MGHFLARRPSGFMEKQTRYAHVVLASLLSSLVACAGGSSTPDGSGNAGSSAGSGNAGSGGAGPAGSGGGPAGSGGTGPAGAGGSVAGQGGQAGGAGSGPAGAGGAAAGSGGRGGAAGGGAGTGGGAAGRGGASGGSGGGTAGGGGATTARYTCPSGQFTAPFPLTATPMRVTGVPPADSFNNNGNDFGIIEGPVWFEGALYVSEIAQANSGGGTSWPARILKITEANAVSIATGDLGTNGLAIDNMGRLVGASHKTGGVIAVNLANMTGTPIVQTYMGARFNTPNDLAVRSDGTIYFTDPTHQAPNPTPQQMTRVYRLPAGSTTAAVVDATLGQPNGIMLSLDEMFLYVADQGQRFRFPVNTDGTVGARTTFPTTGGGSDGMGIDCQGNIYYTTNNTVQVFSPTGTMLGMITVTGVQGVTNVAFGGADHRTLYITALGGGTQKGLFRVTMPLPGMPY
jgi:gluconolactonase